MVIVGALSSLPLLMRRHFALLLTLVVLPACGMGSTVQFVTVATGLVLPAGISVTIEATPAMRTPAYHNALCVVPEHPYQVDTDAFAIRAPSGKLLHPVAVLLGDSAGTDSLPQYYSVLRRQDTALCLNARDPYPPIARRYTHVRLFSPDSLPLSRVFWVSTDK